MQMLNGRTLYITTIFLQLATIAVAQEILVDRAAIRTLVSRWNDGHNLSSVASLTDLYADNVEFYGTLLPSAKCISIKRAMLEKQNDFNQVLKNELILTGYSSGVVRCDFVKTVSVNNKTRDLKSYLIVKRYTDKYLITAESDLMTDQNVGNEPELGTRIPIKEGNLTIAHSDGRKIDGSANTNNSDPIEIALIGGPAIVGIIGLVVAFRTYQRRKRNVGKTTEVTSLLPDPDYAEQGRAFENFIAEQFHLKKGLFFLKDWRSDKFHKGIYAESNRHPDLVYEFRIKDFSKTFSVECKYRSKAYSVMRLMDGGKYKIYQFYHTKTMPVYIALGVGGSPSNPAELYLVPFEDAKPEMPFSELAKYRKWGTSFYYDEKRDRLT